MKITWLGQAGLLIRTKEITVMVDPYLSDHCGDLNPKSRRRMPVDESLFDIVPDVLIVTHNHLDHLDHFTLPHYLKETSGVTTLSSTDSWPELRKYGGDNNYIWFPAGTEWTQGDVRFLSVPACHSEPTAIGVMLEAEGKRIYISGDTLYHRDIVAKVPHGMDLAVVPVNGVGNNMTMFDAARLCRDLEAKCAMPVHWGLFDGLTPEAFPFDSKILPEIYREFEF